MPGVAGGVVAVKEAQVHGLRPRFFHVAVIVGSDIHLARGDEAAVSRHLLRWRGGCARTKY